MRQFTLPFTYQTKWVTVASFTAAITKPTTDKSTATIDALASTGAVSFSVPDGKGAFELRFRSDGDADDTNKADLYMVRAGDTDYTHVGLLTAVQGTQLQNSTAIAFADAISVATGNDQFNPEVSDGEGNSIGTIIVRTRGYGKVSLVFTTKDASTTTLYVDRAWMNEAGDNVVS